MSYCPICGQPSKRDYHLVCSNHYYLLTLGDRRMLSLALDLRRKAMITEGEYLNLKEAYGALAQKRARERSGPAAGTGGGVPPAGGGFTGGDAA